jgi:hypothetical protein
MTKQLFTCIEKVLKMATIYVDIDRLFIAI